MKKVAILMAVAMITADSAGCGCCRRLNDWFNQGSYCGPATAPVMAAPVVVPQEYAVPTCPPTCTVEPGCAAPVTYGPAMSSGCATYGGGAMVAPQTLVAPTPE